MCEFTVKRKSGENIEKIGEDIIFFQYDESGHTRLADILGRMEISAPNALAYEINMLENRHDITIIESELVPFFVKFLIAHQSADKVDVKALGEDLIKEIQKKIS